MGFSYLQGKSWLEVTREERLYCSYLYHDLLGKEREFISWLNPQFKREALTLTGNENWEIGYEVCFYRDFVKVIRHESINKSAYSPKRTFDLCLFSEDSIVILEAKVQQPFNMKDIVTFAKDRTGLPALLHRPIYVRLAAIVPSGYLANLQKYGKAVSLSPSFDAVITWQQLYEKYGRYLYSQADKKYKS